MRPKRLAEMLVFADPVAVLLLKGPVDAPNLVSRALEGRNHPDQRYVALVLYFAALWHSTPLRSLKLVSRNVSVRNRND